MMLGWNCEFGNWDFWLVLFQFEFERFEEMDYEIQSTCYDEKYKIKTILFKILHIYGFMSNNIKQIMRLYPLVGWH